MNPRQVPPHDLREGLLRPQVDVAAQKGHVVGLSVDRGTGGIVDRSLNHCARGPSAVTVDNTLAAGDRPRPVSILHRKDEREMRLLRVGWSVCFAPPDLWQVWETRAG